MVKSIEFSVLFISFYFYFLFLRAIYRRKLTSFVRCLYTEIPIPTKQGEVMGKHAADRPDAAPPESN